MAVGAQNPRSRLHHVVDASLAVARTLLDTSRGVVLPQQFFAQDAAIVAPRLIGKHIRNGEVLLRITEVEAYPPGDSASHCRMGRTPRNAPMWGPPGHAYVYLCYGVHMMLNVTTNLDGEGAAVLIRGCEPILGLDIVRLRRGGRESGLRLDGPGKVGAALDLDRSFSGQPLYEAGGVTLEEAAVPASLLIPLLVIAFA